MTIFTVALVVVSGLVLSPIFRDSWGGWVGRVVDWVGPGHYVITPTRVEIELGFDNNLATVCWIVKSGRGLHTVQHSTHHQPDQPARTADHHHPGRMTVANPANLSQNITD